MARIPIVTPENATGIQKDILEHAQKQYGGVIPGVYKILLYDMNIAGPMEQLYQYMNLRDASPLTKLQREMVATVVNGMIGGAPWLGLHVAAVRRLSKDEHLTEEFASRWPEYDLDPKTRALLAYTQKLTDKPHLMDDSDIEALREAGWDEEAIYQATALISLYNFSGRMEAASGLPQDRVPEHAQFPEASE